MLFEKMKPSRPPQRSSTAAMNEVFTAHVMAQSANLQYANLHQMLLMMGNELKRRQFHIAANEYTSYPATYLGEICMFVARLCAEAIERNRVASDAGVRWLNADLPIMQSVPIEILPKDFVPLLQRAIQADPLQQIFMEDEVLNQLERFISEKSEEVVSHASH